MEILYNVWKFRGVLGAPIVSSKFHNSKNYKVENTNVSFAKYSRKDMSRQHPLVKIDTSTQVVWSSAAVQTRVHTCYEFFNNAQKIRKK